MNKGILVIDDDEAVRKSFCLALEDAPYRVETADSGEKGLAMKRNGQFDLIFLDLKMPGINGVETLREIRKLDSHVPVYIVTAFHKEFLDQLKSAIEDGIECEVLQKPIGSEHILSVTNSLLDRPVSYE